MESTAAAWAGPYEVQPVAANWIPEGPGGDAQAWAGPAVGHHLEYASIVDIHSSSWSLQPYAIPAASYSGVGQQQLVEYNYYNDYCAAAAQHDSPVEKATTQEDLLFDEQMEAYMNSPEKLFEERNGEFKDDAELIKTKMHRYPPCIQAVGEWCIVPTVVAIGPYYHGRDKLQKAETMKHVAARYCIHMYKIVNKNSALSVQEMYDAVVSVAKKIDAHRLYDKDVMAGIRYEDDFLPMMFYDACFLVIYMLRKSGADVDVHLYDFFESNDNDIAHDIMLLENQIPLQLVDAVMRMCTSKPLEDMKNFIAMWRKDGFLQDRVFRRLPDGVDWNQGYYNKAPHLLGLLRFYAVGKRRSDKPKVSRSDLVKMDWIQISAGAVELAKMGFFLTANEKAQLPDMGIANKWIIFKELSMAPLSLDDARASWLVNMAALELCTTPDFDDDDVELEDSAVCSYLLLLCMLMHREDDVHELRTKDILQGGAGLTNKKTLEFFTSLQSLRRGQCFEVVMAEIQNYRNKRPWTIKIYAFLYNYWKYILTISSAVGGFIGIITAIMKLKDAVRH